MMKRHAVVVLISAVWLACLFLAVRAEQIAEMWPWMHVTFGTVVGWWVGVVVFPLFGGAWIYFENKAK